MGAYERFNIALVTADAAVKASAGHLWAVLLTCQGADVDVVIYDDPDSADGTKLLQLSALNGTTEFVDLTRLGGRKAATGLYADVTGTGVQCYVWYE